MAMPDGPPDLFGIGKILGIAASLLFTLRMGQGLRTWWIKRRRAKELEQSRLRRRPEPPPPGS